MTRPVLPILSPTVAIAALLATSAAHARPTVTGWETVDGSILYPPPPSYSVALADPWITYGLHAGYLFW